MKVSYKNLQAGYILQVGDVLEDLHGIEGYIVKHFAAGNYYHLFHPTLRSSSIYKKLGLPAIGDSCPSFATLQALTDEVIMLYEKRCPPKMVTYQMLREGYTLNEGDVISIIHGIEGYYVEGNPKGWYLSNPSGPNNEIYTKLGIKIDGADGFPEKPTRESLSEEVTRLFECSPYKVGDYVKILPRVAGKSYPYGYTDTMEDYEGTVVHIREIMPLSEGSLHSGKIYREESLEGDFHRYKLESNDYTWHSSQFIPAHKTVIDESTLEAKMDFFPPLHMGFTITIGEQQYRVDSNTKGYYLRNISTGINDQCFIDLGIKDKYKWCYQKGTIALIENEGTFPNHATLKSLTECVKELTKECLIKGLPYKIESLVGTLEEFGSDRVMKCTSTKVDAISNLCVPIQLDNRGTVGIGVSARISGHPVNKLPDEWEIKIPQPKKEKKLSEILTIEEDELFRIIL